MSEKIESTIAKNDEPKLAIPMSLALPFDIKTDAAGMSMHLIPEDRLRSLEADFGSSEANAFSASFAIFLTVAGVMLSSWIGECVLGKLSPPLWGLLFSAGVLSLYFGVAYRQQRKRTRDRFREIRERSATVLLMATERLPNGNGNHRPSAMISAR